MNMPTLGIGATPEHAKLLIDSFKRCTGKDLIQLEQQGSLSEQIYHSQTVILSHGTEPDPVLNYGN